MAAEERKIKILLVEDNHMNKVLVKEILTLHGYEITEAASGTEALKSLMEERPDLILMDLHLPGMDGVTATRIIKSDSRNSSIPVLALTASAMRGEEGELLSKGFDGYVAKPIERKKLLDAIVSSMSDRPGEKA
ncbi:MAG: response regulator [Thermodesulfobacteriota bacterium]|nr:MAG: response regulator [Thermodesulfobacteriota bacterium]